MEELIIKLNEIEKECGIEDYKHKSEDYFKKYICKITNEVKDYLIDHSDVEECDFKYAEDMQVYIWIKDSILKVGYCLFDEDTDIFPCLGNSKDYDFLWELECKNEDIFPFIKMLVDIYSEEEF